MTAHDDIANYLRVSDEMQQKAVGDRMKAKGMRSMYGFILEHGRPMALKLNSTHKRGPMRQCFMNAVKMATSGRLVTYCEGFALGSTMPMLHAWCVDREGRVLDPTWPYPDAAYHGVPFKLDYVLRRVVKAECYVSMFDDWMNDWPLLTGAHSVAEAVAA
jgi:hypothetical protein